MDMVNRVANRINRRASSLGSEGGDWFMLRTSLSGDEEHPKTRACRSVDLAGLMSIGDLSIAASCYVRDKVPKDHRERSDVLRQTSPVAFFPVQIG